MTALEKPVSVIFCVAAVYNGILGIAFLSYTKAILHLASIPYQEHPGYIQFPAALLVDFAIMFAVIARNALRNTKLSPYGILLKVCYCGVVFFHWIFGRFSWIWKSFVLADLDFLIGFPWAYMGMQRVSSNRGDGSGVGMR